MKEEIKNELELFKKIGHPVKNLFEQNGINDLNKYYHYIQLYDHQPSSINKTSNYIYKLMETYKKENSI